MQTFANSKVWQAFQAYIQNDLETHETLMHGAVGHSNLHCEASYEAGCYKALRYVIEQMMPEFIAYLTSGKAPGMVESDMPVEPE